MIQFTWNEIGQELYVLAQGLIALILGGILGWEREAAGKWAGVRTHMLVCLAVTFFVKVGVFLIESVSTNGNINSTVLRSDPVRIIEAIVTGIAFLGTGIVFRDPDRNTMRGLTTAASLLTVAPIGIAIAIDRYVVAIGGTLLVLFVLRGVRWIVVRSDNPRHKPPLDDDL